MQPVERRRRPKFVPRPPPSAVRICVPSQSPFVVRAVRSRVTARVPVCDPVLRSVLDEMVSHDVVRELPRRVKVNVTPFLISKGERGVMIADCRPVNAESSRQPGHRAWPTPSSCVHALAAGDFMISIDIARCYDSVMLPPAMCSMFRFGVRTPRGAARYFAYNRIPFGWNWAPAVVQELVESVVRRALGRSGVRAVVYIDDILLMSPSPSKLRAAGERVVEQLSRRGFSISAKSCLHPSQRCTFLGLELVTTPAVTATAALPIPSTAVWEEMFVSDPRRALGLFNWVFPGAFPIVAPIAAAVEAGRRPSWSAARYAALFRVPQLNGDHMPPRLPTF